MAEQAMITEARALLLQFTRSTFKACHVSAPGLEVAFSRDPSISLAELLHEPHDERPATEAAAPAPVSETALGAPHVGTLVSLAPLGTELKAGDLFGEIRVLGEKLPLKAHSGGVVLRHESAAGELVEFGQLLVVLGD